VPLTCEYEKEDNDGNLVGQFISGKLRPHFLGKARSFGFDNLLMQAKATVEAELIMNDGTSINGRVYRSVDQQVLDLLNEPQALFPMRLASQEIVLAAKSSAAICKQIDRPI
jgi:hypothetical protein